MPHTGGHREIDTNWIPFFFICLFFVGLFTLIFITPEVEQTPTAHEVKIQQREADFQLCRDRGGIPISSIYDGRLKRCEFPAYKEDENI